MIGSADWKLHGDNRKTDNRNIILEKITLFWTKFLGFSEVFWAKLYEETATRSGWGNFFLGFAVPVTWLAVRLSLIGRGWDDDEAETLRFPSGDGHVVRVSGDRRGPARVAAGRGAVVVCPAPSAPSVTLAAVLVVNSPSDSDGHPAVVGRLAHETDDLKNARRFNLCQEKQ